jgi:hypothetical protein
MKHVLFLVALAGCIRAPEIVMMDRATTLELQAAGSFRELEDELARVAVSPQPVPLTPDQLEALGMAPPNFKDKLDVTETDRVDELLKQRCIGEANDGLLRDTPDSCRGGADHAEAVALVERTNLARQQLWRWMKQKQPGSSLDSMRGEWRKAHREGVTCGGWLQRDDGQWEAKKC